MVHDRFSGKDEPRERHGSGGMPYDESPAD
jgi:hypothetical protein